MKSSFLLLGFGLLAMGSALQANPENVIPAREAAQHIGETVVVIGKVCGVRTPQPGKILMSLDGPYPYQTCNVVVQPSHAGEVGDLAQFVGKVVAVRGTITKRKWTPRIEITNKDAITVIEP